MSLRTKILAELEAANPDYPGFWEPVVDRILKLVAVKKGEIPCGKAHMDDVLSAYAKRMADPNRPLTMNEIGHKLFLVQQLPDGALPSTTKIRTTQGSPRTLALRRNPSSRS